MIPTIQGRSKSAVLFHKIFFRNCSSLGLWQQELDTNVKITIEKHWANVVRKVKLNDNCSSKHYVLPMFPYPSGRLHMGHVRVYTTSDTIARFSKLNGKFVVHPMGWDAFGLPAENAAIERNIPPHIYTAANIETMKNQLLQLGLDFDWDKEISTCDPKYYKWTQYIFIKLFEQNMVYQNKAMVNWDPVDQTVLADEQVDDMGRSWRSGARVEKKLLTQWFIRTTKYSKQLYDGLDSNLLKNWKDIINLQKHWIGECNGITVHFKTRVDNEIKNIDVWTADPYKFIHGQFIAVSQNHVLFQELNESDKSKLKALNPVTNIELPIYITDEIEYPEGRNICILCPSVDEKDMEVAKKLNLSFTDKNDIIDIENENKKAMNVACSSNVGGYFASSKLKDWLISRQRYWGTPIPIIHCSKCGTVPVPYEELPVELPKSESRVILSEIDSWVNCKCPKCKSNAKRETDTMDTFVDSSWYFYRFLDAKNENMPFDKDNLKDYTPVTLYIGGKEHAVLHLYYARFMSYFLHSLGWTLTEEPFRELLVQGMVMGQSYKLKSSGKYIPPDNVEKVGKEYREKSTGERVLVGWEKMSKSKHNGEDPEKLLNEFGCDTTRLLILADVPPETSRNWSKATFPGVLNWQKRLWLTLREFLKLRTDLELNNITRTISDEKFKDIESKIWESRNFTISTTTYLFKHTHKLSVGISRMQALTNTLRSKLPPEIIAESKEFELALASLIIMLSPVAPHFCAELWAGLQSAPRRLCLNTNFISWDKNVLHQKWPRVDDHFKVPFNCKVDGSDKLEIKLKACDLDKMTEEDAVNISLKDEKVTKALKRGISRINYELCTGSRAILNIYTNREIEAAKNDENKCEKI